MHPENRNELVRGGEETSPLLPSSPPAAPRGASYTVPPSSTWLWVIVFVYALNDGLRMTAEQALFMVEDMKPDGTMLDPRAKLFISGLFQCVFGVIGALVFTRFSDHYGRMPAISVVVLGAMISDILCIVVLSLLPDHPAWYIASTAVSFIFGGNVAFFALANACVADSRPFAARMIIFSLLNGAFSLLVSCGATIGSALVMGLTLHRDSRNQFANATLLLFVISLAVSIALTIIVRNATEYNFRAYGRDRVATTPRTFGSLVGLREAIRSGYAWKSLLLAYFLCVFGANSGMFPPGMVAMNIPVFLVFGNGFGILWLVIFVPIILWRASRNKRPPNSLYSIVVYDRAFIRKSIIPLILGLLFLTVFGGINDMAIVFVMFIGLGLSSFSIGIIPATFSIVSGYLEDAEKTEYTGIAFGCLTVLETLAHTISGFLFLFAYGPSPRPEMVNVQFGVKFVLAIIAFWLVWRNDPIAAEQATGIGVQVVGSRASSDDTIVNEEV